MTREGAQAKGRRLLTEGRLVVEVAAPGAFAATVRGSGDYHRVEFGRGGWTCTCSARSLCSHLVAAQLISAPTTRPNSNQKDPR